MKIFSHVLNCVISYLQESPTPDKQEGEQGEHSKEINEEDLNHESSDDDSDDCDDVTDGVTDDVIDVGQD